MGFDVRYVTSEPSHYEHFVCGICQQLVNIDATDEGGGPPIVTTAAADKQQVFCLSCLMDHYDDQKKQPIAITNDWEQHIHRLSSPPSRVVDGNNTNYDKNALQINTKLWIAAGLLDEVQPLAYRCLEAVQVRLPINNDSKTDWIGNYGSVPSHLVKQYIGTTDPSTTLASSLVPPSPTRLITTPKEEFSALYESGEDVQYGTSHRAGYVGKTTRGTGAHHKRMVDANVVMVTASSANKNHALPPKSPASTSSTGTPPLPASSASARTEPKVGDGDDGMASMDIVPAVEYDPLELARAMTRCDKLKKQANAKFNRSDVEGARLLYSEGLALLADYPLDDNENETEETSTEDINQTTTQTCIPPAIRHEVRLMVASLYSNRAVTFYRERALSRSVDDCNHSLRLDPASEKTYIRKWRALEALLSSNTSSDDTALTRTAALTCLQEGLQHLPTSVKLQEQLRKCNTSRSLTTKTYPHGAASSDQSIMSLSRYGGVGGSSTVLGGGSSSTFLGGGNETVLTRKYEMDISVAGDPTPTILDRAERLKKQANAKFNKGEIATARTLYTDALGCIPTTSTITAGPAAAAVTGPAATGPATGPATVVYSRGVHALLSELYSNRAVTYYREKDYHASVDDCLQALVHNPDSEKSYIRHARALVGLQQHLEARHVLQAAATRFPNSKKLREELGKMREHRGVGTTATTTMTGGGGGTVSSGDSADFNTSVGSLSNFYPPSKNSLNNSTLAGGRTLSTGREELTHADELELSDKLKRNANAKFNRGDIDGARSLYTEAIAVLPTTTTTTVAGDSTFDKLRYCFSSLYANRAVTYYRQQHFEQSLQDCNTALAYDAVTSEKPYSRKARSLASLQRFPEAIQCLHEGITRVKGTTTTTKLEDELRKLQMEHQQQQQPQPAAEDGTKLQPEPLRQDVAPPAGTLPTVSGTHPPAREEKEKRNPHDDDVDTHDETDKYFESVGMGSVPEETSHEFELPPPPPPPPPPAAMRMISREDLERAEKLKKQANAKLNKGDVAGARLLYGEGLACLPDAGGGGCDHWTSDGRDLAATLYANRAVTYFREQQFPATVRDCNQALAYDPQHEKSYIRKWRALMALGTVEEAYHCLVAAVQAVPDSDRLQAELDTARNEQECVRTVTTLLEKRDYVAAAALLEPRIATSENVALWLAAARVDACVGRTERALQRVEKVLVFNAKHADALRVQGYATFLSGEMEAGIRILKESLECDILEEAQASSDLLSECQNTLTSFHKGQARVKRGRYRDAVALFTTAIQDGRELPPRAPLYGILLTERAEAHLLSDQYAAALQDCTAAITVTPHNVTAWTVKIEVYYALDRLQEARDELAAARKTSWGARNETILDAYKKTDFELRLQKVDNEVRFVVATVDCGKSPVGDASGVLHMNHSQRQNNHNLDEAENRINNSDTPPPPTTTTTTTTTTANINPFQCTKKTDRTSRRSPFRGVRSASSPKQRSSSFTLLTSNNTTNAVANNNNNNNATTTSNNTTSSNNNKNTKRSQSRSKQREGGFTSKFNLSNSFRRINKQQPSSSSFQ